MCKHFSTFIWEYPGILQKMWIYREIIPSPNSKVRLKNRQIIKSREMNEIENSSNREIENHREMI